MADELKPTEQRTDAAGELTQAMLGTDSGEGEETREISDLESLSGAVIDPDIEDDENETNPTLPEGEYEDEDEELDDDGEVQATGDEAEPEGETKAGGDEQPTGGEPPVFKEDTQRLKFDLGEGKVVEHSVAEVKQLMGYGDFYAKTLWPNGLDRIHKGQGVEGLRALAQFLQLPDPYPGDKKDLTPLTFEEEVKASLLKRGYEEKDLEDIQANVDAGHLEDAETAAWRRVQLREREIAEAQAKEAQRAQQEQARWQQIAATIETNARNSDSWAKHGMDPKNEDMLSYAIFQAGIAAQGGIPSKEQIDRAVDRVCQMFINHGSAKAIQRRQQQSRQLAGTRERDHSPRKDDWDASVPFNSDAHASLLRAVLGKDR